MQIQDSCFFYSMQVDNEDRLTNILWADDKSMMLIRFAQVDNENRLTNILSSDAQYFMHILVMLSVLTLHIKQIEIRWHLLLSL